MNILFKARSLTKLLQPQSTIYKQNFMTVNPLFRFCVIAPAKNLSIGVPKEVRQSLSASLAVSLPPSLPCATLGNELCFLFFFRLLFSFTSPWFCSPASESGIEYPSLSMRRVIARYSLRTRFPSRSGLREPARSLRETRERLIFPPILICTSLLSPPLTCAREI